MTIPTQSQARGAFRRLRRLGLGALFGVLVTCWGESPRSARAALALDAAGSTTTPVIERALLIHDSSKSLEHWVEELTFPASNAPFGLLMPVPSRPTVSKLVSSPFAGLRAASSVANGAEIDSSVLEQLRRAPETSWPPPDPAQLGRVTSSILPASDTKGVKAWLARNKLAVDASADGWLSRYATRGFYLVALHIAPRPSRDTFQLVTETLQISFVSPRPYFPYAEWQSEPGPRLLSVWLLSNQRQVPVALASASGTQQWVRPIRELDSWRPTPRQLEELLPRSLVALLPPGPAQNARLIRYGDYTLQHFEDQKSTHQGLGDIVLVPEQPREEAWPASKELRRLMSVLDPKVEP